MRPAGYLTINAAIALVMLGACGRANIDPVPDATANAPTDASPSGIDGGLPCVSPPADCTDPIVYACSGQCFVYCRQNVNLPAAGVVCAAWGGCVATIADQNADDCVASQAEEDGAWIGFRQSNEATALDEGWAWCDDTSVSYTNWATDEPNEDGANVELGVQQCASVLPGGGWRDATCTEARPFVCSRPL